MPYPKLDRSRLLIKKLDERENKVHIEKDHIPLDRKPAAFTDSQQKLIDKAVDRIKLARQQKKPVIIAFGAHTIKNGLAPVLIGLMEEGWLTHLATNGAGIIHDWEFAFQGMSSEDVRKNVGKGQFGIWDETGFYINLAIIIGAYEGLGYGESIGKMISQDGLQIPGDEELSLIVVQKVETEPELAASAADLLSVVRRYKLQPGFIQISHPYKKYSVQSRAYELGIPFTGHPMIGHDIIYTHPLNNGAAIGRTALNDFLSFSASVSNLDHGVYMSVGSAVMSPMIFEKAFSMAMNLKLQECRPINDHYMLVVDLAESDWNWKKDGEPPMDNPAYYLRYCKTFQRMGGEMDYLVADNRDFLPAIYQKLTKKISD